MNLMKMTKKTKGKDYSIVEFDIPIHNSDSSTDDFDVKQFKKDIRKFFNDTFGIDITKD